MDRNSKIIIALLAVMLALNVYFSSEQQKLEAEKQRKEQAQAKAKAAAEQPAAASATAAAQTGAGATVPATISSAKEELREIKSGSVTYVLTTAGGGVKRALLGGHDNIEINPLGKEAIGALRREAKVADDLVYKIIEATDKSVTFEATGANGIIVRKVWTKTEGEGSDEHLLRLTVTLSNTGAAEFASENFHLYAGAARSLRPDDTITPYLFWNDQGDWDRIQTTHFSDGWFSKGPADHTVGCKELRWGGVMSRFYVNMFALITKPAEEKPGKVWGERFEVVNDDPEFKDIRDYAMHGAVSLPPVKLAAGGKETFEYEVYLGPREYHRLAKLGRGREQVMDYGMTKPIAWLFVNLMRTLHGLIGSWGWTIVLMTIIIRLCTWPVFASSIKQGRRMAKMAPMMKEIQEKYKDDPARQQQETMAIYRDYGMNPLGCLLPMILQILIFTGLFSVLQSAGELRGQTFLWVKDLSLPDTVTHFLININPLPIFMGVTTMIQMKMTPQSPNVDKTQQNMMMLMPFFFVWICYSQAAALALYYTTQNVFGMFQAWVMRRMMPEDNAPLQKIQRASKPSGSPSMFSFQQPNSGKPTKDKKPRPKLGG